VVLAGAVVAAALVYGGAPKQPRGWRAIVKAAGVRDERVIQAMESVRRADFLPSAVRGQQWVDAPLPIGHQQTTSQPSLIAQMMEMLELPANARVLEVGTGSGYQTALLATYCRDVYSIEIVEPLAAEAAKRLAALGYANVHVRAGDGYLGWPEAAPFDGIVVGAGAPKVPQPLVDQLKPGGRLVIPVGEGEAMSLLVVTQALDGGHVAQRSLPVRFVPLTGENADRDRSRAFLH
jgi:protein-L-isoaspartate(D-aspartate) O-methyltransferase